MAIWTGYDLSTEVEISIEPFQRLNDFLEKQFGLPHGSSES